MMTENRTCFIASPSSRLETCAKSLADVTQFVAGQARPRGEADAAPREALGHWELFAARRLAVGRQVVYGVEDRTGLDAVILKPGHKLVAVVRRLVVEQDGEHPVGVPRPLTLLLQAAGV